MKYMVFGPDYVIRLDRGDEVIGSLSSLCEQDGIGLAWFSGSGEAASAELLSPAEGDDGTLVIDGPCRMVTLTGNVSSAAGRPFIRAHAAFAGRDAVLRGGLLKKAVAASGCEIILHRTFDRMERIKDPASGEMVLDINSDWE